jgi:hypothetical protein
MGRGTLASGGTGEEHADSRRDLLRLAKDLSQSEAEHVVAGETQALVPQAVPLEGLTCAVGAKAVGLDGQPVCSP